MIPRIETTRLVLREWRAEDFETLARFYSDEETMKFLGGVMEANDAWRALAGAIGHWALRGYGTWAVERKSDGALVGRVGLINPHGWPRSATVLTGHASSVHSRLGRTRSEEAQNKMSAADFIDWRV